MFKSPQGCEVLSLERVLKTLECLGLSRADSKVYVYLAKKGPQKGRQIANALQITKQQLYPTLNKLKDKGIVTASFQRPALFSAAAFEKIIKLVIEIKLDQAKVIEETKKDLLDSWRSISWEKQA